MAQEPLKSLDKVKADLSVSPKGLRLEFPKHSPIHLAVDRAKMRLLIVESGIKFFKDEYFSVRVYPKVVVIKLFKDEAGHDEAKFDREEFLGLLSKSNSPL